MDASSGAAAPGAKPVKDGPPPRLMISQMELVNFKSYFGTKMIGPFHKCFSSVVGPNGSGKSNVIDAMLFVFGYRASKIRQGKLSGLIHNSAGHTDVPSCTVSVYFQMIQDSDEHPDGFVVIPGSEVVVSRTAHKDNTSEYRYNGKRTPFKEIAVELRKLGIDLDHNRFLILQGEVESISLMPPKGKYNEKGVMTDIGMLEYLEDMIGSNKFIAPIEALEAKVEELNQARTMKLGGVKMVEKEKDELEGDKDEAEALLAHENEVTLKRNALYQLYAAEAADNVAEAAEKKAAAQIKHDEATAELANGEAALAKLEASHSTELKAFKELQQAEESVRAEFAAYERKDVQLREKQKHGKSTMKKLTKAIAKAEASVSETEAEVAGLTDDTVRFGSEIESLNTDRAAADTKLDAILEAGKDERATMKIELEEKQKALEPFTARVSEARAAADLCREELDLLLSNKRSLESQLSDARKNLDDARSTGDRMAKEIATMQARETEARQELAAAEAALSRISEAEPDLAKRVQSKRANVEEQKAGAGQARQQNAVFAALGKLGWPGVYGRLGDLGAIDGKFDCAVTTACGALNNLVVDTIKTGQRCINYLKQHNIGRVTIICLDKQKEVAKRMALPFTAPSGCDRLFDLITPKRPEFAAAFYYGLRNTLVAGSLDAASKVAYGKTKQRVVTLKGELFETSGTMSGGGGRPQTGGMSASNAEPISAAELSKLETDLKADEARLVQHRADRVEYTGTLKNLKKELSSFDTRIKKCNMGVANAKKAEPELAALVEELEAKVAAAVADQKKQTKLERALADATATLDAATAAAAGPEAEVAAIEKAIKAVGGVPLKAARAKLKSIDDQLESRQSALTKAKVSLKTAKSKLSKINKKIAKDKAELDKASTQVEAVLAELESMEEGAEKVMIAVAEAQKTLKEKEGMMKTLAKEHKAAESEVNRLQSLVVDEEENLRTYSSALKENQAKSKHWAKQIKRLVLHKIGSDYFDEEDEEDIDAAADPMDTAAADADAEVTKEAGAPAPASAPVTAASKKKTLTTLTADELAALDADKLEQEIAVAEEQLGEKKANIAAIKAYYEKEEQYIAKVAELDAITEERDGVRAEYEDLRKQRLDTFFAGFKVITTKLKEMYQMITLGGDAELEYVDNINPFSEGIVFSVRPPRKSWKAIQNLSGGEKTLSSLALVFALHHYKPNPLYVMDEIDAALDFKNVSIVAHYIKERTKNAQFIIISLRNNMFELADRLVGIYKTDNCTKTVTINPAAIAAASTASAPVAAVAGTEKVHEAAATPGAAGTPLGVTNM